MKSERIKSPGQRTRDRDEGQRGKTKRKGGVRKRGLRKIWRRTDGKRHFNKVRKKKKPKIQTEGRERQRGGSSKRESVFLIRDSFVLMAQKC